MALAAPTGLLTEGLVNPLRIIAFDPLFSWNEYPSGQIRFQLQVATSSIFDSGTIILDTNQLVSSQESHRYLTTIFIKWNELLWDDDRVIHWNDIWAAIWLNRGIKYYWRLRLWNGDGDVTDWSMTSVFRLNVLPVVTIISAIPVEGKAEDILITYRVFGGEGLDLLITNLQYLYNDVWYVNPTIVGDTSGLDSTIIHTIIWNSGADLPNIDYLSLFKFTANDGVEDSDYDEIEIQVSNAGPIIQNHYVIDPINEFINGGTYRIRVGGFFKDAEGIVSILYEVSINDAVFATKAQYLDSTNRVLSEMTELYKDFDIGELTQGEELGPIILADAIYYRITALDVNGIFTIVSGKSSAAVAIFQGYRKISIQARRISDELDNNIWSKETIIEYTELKP